MLQMHAKGKPPRRLATTGMASCPYRHAALARDAPTLARLMAGGLRRQPSIFRLEAIDSTKAGTWDGTLVVRFILWRISLARLKTTAFGRFFACARSDTGGLSLCTLKVSLEYCSVGRNAS